jgi:hypothetical protein
MCSSAPGRLVVMAGSEGSRINHRNRESEIPTLCLATPGPLRRLIRAAPLAQPLQTALSAEPSSCSQEMYVVSTLTITTATRLPFGRETATLR